MLTMMCVSEHTEPDISHHIIEQLTDKFRHRGGIIESASLIKKLKSIKQYVPPEVHFALLITYVQFPLSHQFPN